MSAMRSIMKSQLTRLGHPDVVFAEDGVAALDVLRLGGADLIFSDWNMPRMNGLELLRSIRSDATLRDIPFVIVTAAGDRKGVIEAVRSGVSHYLVKPFDENSLADRITKVMARTSRAGHNQRV